MLSRRFSVIRSDDEKNSAIITGIIKQQSPLDFTDYKQSTILRRIVRRAAYNKFTRLEDYIEFLKSTPGEIETLTKDFLISVTDSSSGTRKPLILYKAM